MGMFEAKCGNRALIMERITNPGGKPPEALPPGAPPPAADLETSVGTLRRALEAGFAPALVATDAPRAWSIASAAAYRSAG